MVTHKSVCFFVNVFKVYLQKIINYQLMNIVFSAIFTVRITTE